MVYEILYQNKHREMNPLRYQENTKAAIKDTKNIKICKLYLENKNCLSRYEFQFEPKTILFFILGKVLSCNDLNHIMNLSEDFKMPCYLL